MGVVVVLGGSDNIVCSCSIPPSSSDANIGPTTSHIVLIASRYNKGEEEKNEDEDEDEEEEEEEA